MAALVETEARLSRAEAAERVSSADAAERSLLPLRLPSVLLFVLLTPGLLPFACAVLTPKSVSRSGADVRADAPGAELAEYPALVEPAVFAAFAEPASLALVAGGLPLRVALRPN